MTNDSQNQPPPKDTHFVRNSLVPLPTKGKLPVTKLDAAVRQLETAITIWFHDGDPVSTCTLASAAHEILHALSKHKGGKVQHILDPERISDIVVEEYHKDIVAILRADHTFFKHADIDPDATHFLAVANLPILMLDAVLLYNSLDVGMRPILRVLIAWMRFSAPKLFNENLEEKIGGRISISATVARGKSAFFNEMLPEMVRQNSGAGNPNTKSFGAA